MSNGHPFLAFQSSITSVAVAAEGGSMLVRIDPVVLQALRESIPGSVHQIEQAFLRACFRIDGISEVQTEISCAAPSYLTQKSDAIITSTHSVLREYVAEEFGRQFRALPECIRLNIQLDAWSVIDREFDHFQQLVISLLTTCQLTPLK